MFSTGWFRRAFCVLAVLVSGTVLAAPAFAGAPAGQAADATLFRVFLRDGTTLVSYGEYARVADRLVITLPVGSASSPDLQLLSIRADTVDWAKTDAYADSARAARYAATTGPNDYALLNEAVSRALTDVALTADPARKISMAGEARQNVTRWASEHYGYRAADVARLATLFDDVIAETRRNSGESNVELGLVATMAAPPDAPLLPNPTAQESVELALRAVTLAPDATERTSLLEAIERTLRGSGADAAWAAPLRARVSAALAVEQRTDRAYATLSHDALRSASRDAAAGDVSGVERIVRTLLKQDDRLGQRRPQEMAALLATLDAKLDAARRERLARDHRAARQGVLSQYRRAVAEPLAIIRRMHRTLDEVRRLAGPSRAQLARLAKEMALTSRLLQKISPPEEMTTAHALLRSAVQLAARAAEGRQRAIMTRSMQTAQEASSAAAGALMLFDRASEEMGIQQSPSSLR